MGELMKTFEINDRVIYRTRGVCIIVDIVKKTFHGMEEKEYYVCESISGDHYRSYVPIGSETASQMKYVPSPEEIDRMIDEAFSAEHEYLTDKKARETYYSEAQKRSDEVELIRIYAMLAERRRRFPKMPAADIRMMSFIEKVIDEEFAYSLGIERSEVEEYIKNRLN